ncbi:Kef-type potassium/proton antiporter (CPA2 family) [Pseudoduganella flava]|uniref:Glutathione-regulated potassium-efflux system protein KefC n=1 Tax=Pseudoduganella flava TaxID=871742 RepID=A0A562PGI1_9BURK|nr:glutathione-regulated potassium-efflux system protein KefC [Pseudoduganella flava]QGZ40372.1 glutathione-regulated potassium-efflux system protein KefC [Pseudoduganella flava]TWI43565.1 Kef-type potassium/proton antiporter (CPA2 family) [Pseudoduganella flava]
MHDLLLTPIVFLLTAVLLVPLAQRLRLGSVLGYLVGGCLIGPWGLALVGKVELIGHVAEIGVVLMLFLIGLELQADKLMAMRRLVLGGGALQLVACGAAFAAVAALLGLGWVAAAVAGIALALSSTAIAVQTMQERHLQHTPAGKAAFAILLFQDMAAIPLLVVLPLLAPGGDAGDFSWLRAAGAVAAVLLIGRYLMPPLLRFVAGTRLREIFTAFALLLVLGIAQLMSLADLSMGLGAFLAGVLLASSEYRKALETDLEPFKGLLLGLFFTSVGMSVNLGMLAAQPWLIGALTIGYVVLKMIVMAALARALKVPAAQRWPFAAVMAQGSEFAFVVLAAAQDERVLSAQWTQTLVLVAALSMALTPLAMLAAGRLGKALNPKAKRPADVIEPQGARVIIAGFGRVGQIAGRLLMASGFKVTVLDNDPELIETLRRFGHRVFYGDATRLDLLRQAGAAEAVLIINAIDDMPTSLALTDLVREHFPHLKIVGRARNVTHLFELRARGVETIERETFDGALLLGRHALEHLGVDADTAERARERFRAHNLATLESLQPHYQDEAKRISIGQAAQQELARSFEEDRLRLKEGAPESFSPGVVPPTP